MNKIYCDVCGTAFSEKDTHCHNCGCARPVMDHVSDESVAESSTYTYVKGGRFSKTNVRKRNQGVQRDNVTMGDETTHEEHREAGENTDKGLVVAVCVLLLAIVAVVIYIVARFYAQEAPDNGADRDVHLQYSTEESVLQTMMPEVTESSTTFATEETSPQTTGDTVPNTEPIPTENQNYYVKPFKLSTEKRKNDVTIYRNGSFELELRDATGELMDIDWVVADTEICSVAGNTVTGLKVGKTTVSVTIDDTVYSCIVRVKG